jgi:hypothetical protein
MQTIIGCITVLYCLFTGGDGDDDERRRPTNDKAKARRTPEQLTRKLICKMFMAKCWSFRAKLWPDDTNACRTVGFFKFTDNVDNFSSNLVK